MIRGAKCLFNGFLTANSPVYEPLKRSRRMRKEMKDVRGELEEEAKD